MTLAPFALLWTLLALFVLGLVLYRKVVSSREDDMVHLSEGEAKLIPRQIATAHKLEVIDHWGKILTVVAVAGGLLLASIYIYQVWQESLKP